MSKKFTEEQYKEIVRAWRSKVTWSSATQEVINYITKEKMIDMCDESLALANPLTREWAHDKFVEKEKKYIWESKQRTDTGRVKRLYDSAIGITDSFNDKAEFTHNGNLITEAEMRKWGYNPDMFDKREL